MRLNIILILLPFSMVAQNPNSDSLGLQTIISLNTATGIPVSPYFPNFPKERVKSTCPIEGFDVDENGKFYFLSGKLTTLSIFDGNKKLLSKNYNEFYSTKIYLYDNNIYLVDPGFKKNATSPVNNLYILDRSNGGIKNSYYNLVTNNTQPPKFNDSLFVLEVHGELNEFNIPKRGFLLYNLSGKFIKEVGNSLNVSNQLYQSIFSVKLKGALGYSFLGFWNKGRVYMHLIYDDESWDSETTTQFTLTDSLGKIVKTYQVRSKKLGEIFYPGAFDYEVIRNGSIFILRRDEGVENAIVTELPLDKIFK